MPLLGFEQTCSNLSHVALDEAALKHVAGQVQLQQDLDGRQLTRRVLGGEHRVVHRLCDALNNHPLPVHLAADGRSRHPYLGVYRWVRGSYRRLNHAPWPA